MLTDQKIHYLAKLADINVITIEGVPTGIAHKSGSYKPGHIKVEYEEFRKHMGLDDLRFSWLLSPRTMIAGGAVMNWIWGESTNEDIDFFFLNTMAALDFILMISRFGFEQAFSTGYANTYMHPDNHAVIQVIGASHAGTEYVRPSQDTFIPFGNPSEILDRFDFNVCRFLVDDMYVYTTRAAIIDLIELKVSEPKDKRKLSINRVLKYAKKGFYTDSKIRSINIGSGTGEYSGY